MRRYYTVVFSPCGCSVMARSPDAELAQECATRLHADDLGVEPYDEGCADAEVVEVYESEAEE